jgi:hypothetical protein
MTFQIIRRFRYSVANEISLPEYLLNNAAVHLSTP